MNGAIPAPPSNELAQGAAALHQLFTAYMRAGFTEPQALYLTVCAVAMASDAPEVSRRSAGGRRR